ncbi:MAG: hypothetical protein ACRDRW_12940 [Pseudonocardiaceae bacterium]
MSRAAVEREDVQQSELGAGPDDLAVALGIRKTYSSKCTLSGSSTRAMLNRTHRVSSTSLTVLPDPTMPPDVCPDHASPDARLG